MFVAKELKDKNICEYLLYMWQVEDTIRAFGCDLSALDANYISLFKYGEEEMKQLRAWYGYLIGMMKEEKVVESGHLQINKGSLSLLTDRHLELLKDPNEADYHAAYYRALPFIVELRAKGGQEKPELETCLEALYGAMVLRLKQQDMTPETQKALTHISQLLALLAKEYKNA
ncbi:MAG: DUF4924 family protein [Bacteroidales bacterium]|nr:DUF4924 family protein [Candidatus Physcousia equi]